MKWNWEKNWILFIPNSNLDLIPNHKLWSITLALKINKIFSAGCSEDFPFAYDYHGDNDYCCAEELINDDCHGYARSCSHEPPCENHPSVMSDEADDNIDGKN